MRISSSQLIDRLLKEEIMSTGNDLWHIHRAEDIEECMFMPVEEKEYHQCCEEPPEELDAEAEQNFGTLDISPFNGLALNTSEGLQEQSNDDMISAVTSGQESVEITSDLCTEETQNGSADKTVRDDYEIMDTRDDYDIMCTATDTTAGKGKELSSSTESAFTNPNTAIGAADEAVTYSQISKESTANYTALNKLDKDKQNCGREMPEAKSKASYKESRQYKLPENRPCPKSKKKERKAESDMKHLLEYQAKLAQKINARRFEHQLKETQMMADGGSYEIPESPLDKRLRRIDKEIALIKGLMDLVKSLTEGEEDHNMSLSAIETIEALKRNFTPSILLKYPLVVIFHSIRRYANNEKIRSKGEYIYSLFDAMFPKDGFEDFVYAFERAMKIYRERFVKEEQFSRKIINKMCASVGKNGRSAYTVESWNALQAERYSNWNKFFQAYDKPKESTVKQGEKKKSVKADVKKVEEDFDDVKNNDLPKGRLQGRKRGRPTSTKEDLCKVEPKVEEMKFKILKEEDTKPDVKSVAELSELKQSPDLSLVKIKEEMLENDEISVVKTEVLSDNINVRDVKGKGRKQPDRKAKYRFRNSAKN